MTPQQLWRAIHIYTRVRGVEGFDALLASVRELLPCAECQRHLDEYLAQHPPDTSSPDALFHWSWQFHNAVNKRTGKKRLSLVDAHRQLRTTAAGPHPNAKAP